MENVTETEPFHVRIVGDLVIISMSLAANVAVRDITEDTKHVVSVEDLDGLLGHVTVVTGGAQFFAIIVMVKVAGNVRIVMAQGNVPIATGKVICRVNLAVLPGFAGNVKGEDRFGVQIVKGKEFVLIVLAPKRLLVQDARA